MSNELTLIEQAHAKMLEEMSKPHSEVLDYIHNWLCSQADEELLKGILTDGKTIQSAYNRLVKTAKTEKREVISPDLGFQIITDYFKGDETEIKMPGGVRSDRPDPGPTYSVDGGEPISYIDLNRIKADALAEAEKKLRAEQNEKTKKKADVEKKKADDTGLLDMFEFGIDDPFKESQKVEEEGDDDADDEDFNDD